MSLQVHIFVHEATFIIYLIVSFIPFQCILNQKQNFISFDDANIDFVKKITIWTDRMNDSFTQ